MKIERIDKETIVRTVSEPVELRGTSETGILLLHGYTGSPHDMKYLAGELNRSGYSVLVPRLPGHGTNQADFLQSNGEQWLREALDAYLSMSGKYENLGVIGLSMGGILATLLAAQFPVSFLGLLAPGLKTTKERMLHLTPWLKYVLKPYPKEVKEEQTDPDLMFLSSEYWEYQFPGQLAEVAKLQKKAVASLRKVVAPTLVIVSEKDGTIPVSVKDLITNKIASDSVRTIVLKKSGHVVTRSCEKEKVAGEIISWIQNIG